jgi:hypothetical protein
LPIGYLIVVLYLGVCTAFAAAPPRRARTRRFSLAYWFAFVVNEIPVLALGLLVASTLLALLDGDLASLGGVVAVALAAVVAGGLILLTARGLRGASKLRDDIGAAIGPLPREAHAVRALLWPFTARPRNVERVRNVMYGDGPGRRLDVYRTESSRLPTLVYFHGGAFRSGDKGRQARPLLQTLSRLDRCRQRRAGTRRAPARVLTECGCLRRARRRAAQLRHLLVASDGSSR